MKSMRYDSRVFLLRALKVCGPLIVAFLAGAQWLPPDFRHYVAAYWPHVLGLIGSAVYFFDNKKYHDAMNAYDDDMAAMYGATPDAKP